MPTCKTIARMIPRLLLHLGISGHFDQDAVRKQVKDNQGRAEGDMLVDDCEMSTGYRIAKVASGARITRVLGTLAPQAQHLRLERLPLLSDLGVRGILRLVGPQLSSLSLNMCKSLTAEGIACIGRLAPRLRRLSLRSCFLLNRTALDALLAGLDPERVSSIDFSLCLLLQDDDVRAILKRWCNLRVLHLSRVRNISDWGLRVLDPATHVHLEYLGLAHLPLLTKSCVLRLASLPALRWIELPARHANDPDIRQAMGDRVFIRTEDAAGPPSAIDAKDRAAMTSSLGVPSLSASTAGLTGNTPAPSPVPVQPTVPGMPPGAMMHAVQQGGATPNLSTSLNASSFVPPPVHPGALMNPVPVPMPNVPLGQQQVVLPPSATPPMPPQAAGGPAPPAAAP